MCELFIGSLLTETASFYFEFVQLSYFESVLWDHFHGPARLRPANFQTVYFIDLFQPTPADHLASICALWFSTLISCVH